MNLEYLKLKINESVFSNEELAEMIGVSRATFFNYKSNKNDIPVQKLDKLIKILNLDLNELFK